MHRRSILVAFLLALAPVPTSSCATFAAALPHVVAIVVEAGQIIDSIASFVDRYFKKHPDPKVQVEVDKAIAKCRAALNVLMRTAEGAQKLDDTRVDAAFEDFKVAYLQLLALVQPYGVHTVHAGGVQAVGDEVLQVPEPIVFKRWPK